MNILENGNVKFAHAGFFTSRGKWRHPERRENTYEIIYVTDGRVCMWDETAGEVELSPGELILLDSGKVHRGTRACAFIGCFLRSHREGRCRLTGEFSDILSRDSFSESCSTYAICRTLPRAPCRRC